MADRWVISCISCDDQREAYYNPEDYGLTCVVCGRTYYGDDTTAINLTEAEYYHQSFRGAKVAGMIPEKEFEGDREQMKRG